MELALSLGGDPSRPFTFLTRKTSTTTGGGSGVGGGGGGSSCMGLGLGLCGRSPPVAQQTTVDEEGEERESDSNSEELDQAGGGVVVADGKEDSDADDDDEEVEMRMMRGCSSSSPDQQPVVQLNLLPFSPVPRRRPPSAQQIEGLRFPWLVSPENVVVSEPGSTNGFPRILEPNRIRPEDASAEDRQSSPNSAASPFVEFSLYPSTTGISSFGIGRRNGNNKRPIDGMMNSTSTNAGALEGCSDPTTAPPERAGSRGSDDEENGSTRKKLRLSKEQSAFLEESFKEHHTLNPKQKLALAKQLNLRPRQVEVWFQNRRARTKLKQTEVDCEYLKRCCETLTEENRRLQKEVHELRALNKTSSHPFYMQLPPTTLTMCPSCERVATTGPNNNHPNTITNTVTIAAVAPPTTALTLAKPTTLSPPIQAQKSGGVDSSS